MKTVKKMNSIIGIGKEGECTWIS